MTLEGTPEPFHAGKCPNLVSFSLAFLFLIHPNLPFNLEPFALQGLKHYRSQLSLPQGSEGVAK